MNARSALLCFVSVIAFVGAAHASDEPTIDDDNHPGRTVGAEMIRQFIIDAVAKNSELQEFVPNADLKVELPTALDLYFPQRWPGVFVSGESYEPFAMLGQWKVFFGTDECEDCVRQVVFSHRRYRLVENGTEIACRDVVLNPVIQLDAATASHDRPLKLESWYVEDYALLDRGYLARGVGVKCIAAGGALKGKAGTEESVSRYEIAFIGHVERGIESSRTSAAPSP